MKHLSLLFLLFIFCSQSLYSAGGFLSVNPRSGGMGNLTVMLADHYSCLNNPAGLAYWNTHSFAGSYENRFMIPELAAMSFGVNVPVFNGTIGLAANSYGYNLYGEQNFSLAFGKILSEQFALGLKLNYFSIKQSGEYNNYGGVIGEVGLMSYITEEVRIGAHIYNINRAKITDYQNERIPTILRLGVGYQMNKKVLLCLEAEKDIDAAASIKVGLDYQAMDPLFIRCGIQTNPTILTFGFGLEWKQFMLDFSTSQHAILGYSPQLGLIYSFNKSSKSNKSGVEPTTLK
jgi:hypothetical protein